MAQEYKSYDTNNNDIQDFVTINKQRALFQKPDPTKV